MLTAVQSDLATMLNRHLTGISATEAFDLIDAYAKEIVERGAATALLPLPPGYMLLGVEQVGSVYLARIGNSERINAISGKTVIEAINNTVRSIKP